MPITPTPKIWMNGELVDWESARIHVLTHTLHYGSGVFEGIRAYETEQGPAVFRLTDHIVRLFNSAKIIGLDIPYTVEEIVQATKDTVASTGLPGCYVRPIAYYGYGEMGLNTLPCSVDVAIACWPWGAYLGDDAVEQGRADEDQLLDPPRAQHDAARVQDDRQLRRTRPWPRSRRSRPGTTRRSCWRRAGWSRSARARTSSPRATASSSPRRSPLVRSKGITQSSVMTIARDLGFDLPARPPGPQRPVHRRGAVRVRHGGRDQRRELGR